MRAFQFDTAGLFAGETDADESPMEPGVYLLPARCTLVMPPEKWPNDLWPRFNGVEWELVNKPEPEATPDPVAKLTAFLLQNPDVVELIKTGQQ